MATTQLAFGNFASGDSGLLAALMRKSVIAETLTPTAGNQVSTNAGLTSAKSVVRIATDTQVYASFGAAPNATTDTNRIMVPAGHTEYVVIEPGDKVAVVTAP